MTLKRTQKKQDQLYEDLVRRQTKRVREMTEPPTTASKLYPHLPRSADDQPKQSPIQGWSHLRKK
jgi:hypothetical protein